VAAPADLAGGAALPWWNNGTTVWCNRVRNDGLYTGRINTDSIIARHSVAFVSFAAGDCAKYAGGGYGDWYLPSLEELSLLVALRDVIGGFAHDFYWSSTEGNFDMAKFRLMSNVLHIGNTPKTNSLRVRPIRRF
jgi:hypothetical protein